MVIIDTARRTEITGDLETRLKIQVNNDIFKTKENSKAFLYEETRSIAYNGVGETMEEPLKPEAAAEEKWI